jgi:hypothetical protein
MKSTNIVSDLIRAANDCRSASAPRLRNLLYAAIREIRDLREETGIPSSGTSQDAVVGLLSVAAHVEQQSDEDLRAALMEAADLIRTLRVVADSGVEFTLRILEDTPNA